MVAQEGADIKPADLKLLVGLVEKEQKVKEKHKSPAAAKAAEPKPSN